MLFAFHKTMSGIWKRDRVGEEGRGTRAGGAVGWRRWVPTPR